jgi:hypothetical protein
MVDWFTQNAPTSGQDWFAQNAPAPPAAGPHVAVESSLPDRAMGAVSKAADVVGSIAKPFVTASAPNVALQFAKHLQGQPNSLKDIPPAAMTAFLASGGFEGAAGEGAGDWFAKNSPEAAAAKIQPEAAPPPPTQPPPQPEAAAQTPLKSEPTPTPSQMTPPAGYKPLPKAAIEKQLNDALGAQPLVPGVSLRNQPAAQATAAGKLPAGFTAVDSSVIKGYKYDAGAQEFTAITKNGQAYTHGEVTPDQVAQFEKADSKGSAWTSVIRNNSPLVAKNGVPVKPVAAPGETPAGDNVRVMRPPEITLPPGQSESDLTPLLQESLKRARASRTAANP